MPASLSTWVTSDSDDLAPKDEVLVMGGTAAGQRGLWPPWFAVWLGNGVMLATSAGFYWRFLRQ